jgi:hypothetical protein
VCAARAHVADKAAKNKESSIIFVAEKKHTMIVKETCEQKGCEFSVFALSSESTLEDFARAQVGAERRCTVLRGCLPRRS